MRRNETKTSRSVRTTLEKEVKDMPGFNGTGPMGEGPMTGGGRGYCISSDRGNVQGGYRGNQGSPDFGRSFGRGFGRGFGRRRGMGGYRPTQLDSFAVAQSQRTFHTQNISDEGDSLRTQIDGLKRALEDIQKAVADLQSRSS